MSTEIITVGWREEARRAGYDPDEIFREMVSYFEETVITKSGEKWFIPPCHYRVATNPTII